MEELILISISKHELKCIIDGAVKSAISAVKFTSPEIDKSQEIFSIEETSVFLSLAKPTIYTLTSKGKSLISKRGKNSISKIGIAFLD
ncbi:MAG: hypothetical protein R2784_16870 [Saprospiraceae bacterium]